MPLSGVLVENISIHLGKRDDLHPTKQLSIFASLQAKTEFRTIR